MKITAYFASDGEPAEGLTPTVKIRDLLDNSVVVNSAAMSEVGDGFYKYEFADYDSNHDYVILCDGGALLNGAERYSIATTEAKTISRPVGAVATDAGNSATAFKTTLASTIPDFCKGAFLKITSGVLAGQTKKIASYDDATKIVTLTSALTGTPADDVTFSLVDE